MIAVTVGSRCGAGCEVFIDGRTAASGEHSRFGTDLFGHDTVRYAEMSDGLCSGKSVHDFFPEDFVICPVESLFGKSFLTVVSCPHAACIVGSISDEPYIVVSGRCTCLSGDRHAVLKLYFLTGTPGNNIAKCACKKSSGIFRYGLTCFRRIVDHDITVLILDSCIENRTCVGPFVGNCSVGCSQFKIGDTVIDTAECERLINVIALGKGREPEF